MAGIGDSFFRGGNPNDFVIDINPSGVKDFFQPDRAGIGAINDLNLQDIPISVGGDTVKDILKNQEKFLYNDSFLNNENKENINKEDLSAFEASKQTTTPFDANFIIPPKGPDKALAELQASLSKEKYGQPGKGAPDVITGNMKEGIEGVESAEDKAFAQGLDAYINAARGTNAPAPDVKSLDEYKEIFSKITGVDVSGKIDKSAALMSFGLALMQNRAGKGFNLGRILGEVGKAGEIALPKLEQAKANAKAAALAGGKYALQQRSADEAQARAAKEKGMARSDYYVVPKMGKDGSPSSFIANIDRGSLQKLSPYELDALYNTEGFNEKYTVVDGSMYSTIIAEAMKTPEAAEIYDTKTPRKIELLGPDVSDLFTIETWRPLPTAPDHVEGKLVGTGTDTYNALAKAARDLQKAKARFIEGFGIAEGTNAFKYTADKIDSLGAAFGIKFSEDANPTSKLQLFFTKLQAQNAKEILGEAGKTISDADRKLVADIVGNPGVLSDSRLLEEKLNQLYQEIIIKKEQDILSALGTLDRYTNRNVSSLIGGGDDLSEEDEKERVAALKQLGIEV